MRNFTHTAICLLLALLVMLLGTGAFAAEEAALLPEETGQAYRDVLLGDRDYLRRGQDGGEDTTAFLTGEFLEWYGFVFEAPLRYEAFCLNDLNGDGSPEVILKLSQDFGYEALRVEGGQVLGYPFVWRAMEKLTLQGDIHGSNGWDDFGWYKVRFENGMMETDEICWKHPLEGGGYQYRIGDSEVSEADFTAFSDSLWAQDGPEWTAFTPENVGAL